MQDDVWQINPLAEGHSLDGIDRQLLTLLQQDASRPYAALGQAVGLSAAAAHERVRKLRERGIIRGTVVDASGMVGDSL